jgi:hypothetical protein
VQAVVCAGRSGLLSLGCCGEHAQGGLQQWQAPTALQFRSSSKQPSGCMCRLHTVCAPQTSTVQRLAASALALEFLRGFYRGFHRGLAVSCMCAGPACGQPSMEQLLNISQQLFILACSHAVVHAS